ncbi:winged helix-turn-helix transcriptional regulator [Yinghuangia seranimata]|uniref:winged helix-turn-helix transcriptional regulator n=1 Tax=Yinghuangia seranimata TaxID=408067 RepID=UPI00248B2B45|nr:helix-turn-helix domain-containing protein [Yinghuangia seranimata]MDI2126978.1 helix-turn-helix domain-containing protein [Yinghuangia seranimata]
MDTRVIVASSGLPADVFSAKCATRQVLDHIASKWTVLVVDALGDGPRRHADLRRRVEGVTQKMLTQTLRLLEADGFVVRTVTPTVPPEVSYALTPLGRSLREPIAAIRDWTESHINDIERARAEHAAARPVHPTRPA